MGMATALAAARLAIVYSINIHSTTYVKTPDQPQAMPRRTKQEAQQTRHALLDAAELVFERRGVAGTSLQEVAAAAGLTRGAGYWHFRDKADLFNAMMDRAVLPFEQHWLQPAADPLARLRDRRCRSPLQDILGCCARRRPPASWPRVCCRRPRRARCTHWCMG